MTQLMQQQSRQDYISDRDWVISRTEDVYQWAIRIRRIKEGEAWKLDAATWGEWCEKFCGKTAAAIRNIIWSGEQREARKLLKETPEEPASQKSRFDSSPPPPKDKVIDVPSSPAKEVPVPEAPKTPVLQRTETLSLKDTLVEIERDLDRLAHQQLCHEHLSIVRRALFSLHKAQHMLQPSLPIEVESSKKRSRGTLEEVITYCVLVKLTREDGEWFFNKCAGCGWLNNGLPIKDWQATVNAWRIQQIFPSQKNQTYGNSKTYRGTTPQHSRNEGTTPRPEGQPDYGEAARRKQELQSKNAARNSGVA